MMSPRSLPLKPREEVINQHINHEGYHKFLLLLIVLVVIFAQFGLVYWKKHGYKSYALVSLVGLWLIPPFFGLSLPAYRFFFVWLLWSANTGFILSKSSQESLEKETPRLVYNYFYVSWKITYVMTVLGIVLIGLEILGFIHLILAVVPAGLSQTIDFFLVGLGVYSFSYGIYFGMLSRDTAEFTGKGEIPRKRIESDVCNICNQDFGILLPRERKITLDCSHEYHERCIKGWTIIGKKDMCPFCSEKVNLNKFHSSPWQKQDLLFGGALDFIRYMLVWNPVIFFIIQVGLEWLD